MEGLGSAERRVLLEKKGARKFQNKISSEEALSPLTSKNPTDTFLSPKWLLEEE
mgnify:CR=1 FL=1